MSKLSFCSWSGGKDSCLALYKALNQDYDVKYLLTMMSDVGDSSRSHGISSRLLFEQADRLKVQMIQKHASWNNYENMFIESVKELKKSDINHGIFGDMDVQEHLDWVIRICNTTDIQYYEPLWKYDRTAAVKEFIDLGFKAVIISCDSKLMSETFLGRELTIDLIDELSSIGVDAAGENGEYHTFVYDGPIFNRGIDFIKKEIKKSDNYLFLEIA